MLLLSARFAIDFNDQLAIEDRSGFLLAPFTSWRAYTHSSTRTCHSHARCNPSCPIYLPRERHPRTSLRRRAAAWGSIRCRQSHRFSSRSRHQTYVAQKQHARCVCPIDCTHDKSTRCSWAAYVLGRNRCATEAKATRMPLRRETLRPSAQARRARGVQPLRRASSERTASSVERCTGQASISCCCLSSTSPPQQSPSQRLFHSDDHNT